METNLEATAELFGTDAGTAADKDTAAPVVGADAVGAEFLAAINEDDAQKREVSPSAEPVPTTGAAESVLEPAGSPGVSGPSAGVPASAVAAEVTESGAPP